MTVAVTADEALGVDGAALAVGGVMTTKAD